MIIYVHGTNGTGKTTLARRVLLAAGGVRHVVRHPETDVWATYTHTALAAVGKYKPGGACGGADGVQPYSAILLLVRALHLEGVHVLAEGSMTPGVATCAAYMEACDGAALFVHLEVERHLCVQRVVTRRMRKGKLPETFDPHNLDKKKTTSAQWVRNLQNAGLPTASGTPEKMYATMLHAYGLQPPSLDTLLS